jgi:hypothetical protein
MAELYKLVPRGRRRKMLPRPEKRLLSREEAADYCNWSPSFFDAMVHANVAPKAKLPPGRTKPKGWDRHELDDMIAGLPNSGDDIEEGDEDGYSQRPVA